MDINTAYDRWADQYDSNENKTRDLEAIALSEMLSSYTFDSCLEIGCGTGKNTGTLLNRAGKVVCVDFSEEMISKAKEKYQNANVGFHLADINQPWNFTDRHFSLVTFSLVLEHIEDIVAVFHKAAAVLNKGGYLYMGELHPSKQYAGSKARFEDLGDVVSLRCFTHHTSEYLEAAEKSGFVLVSLREFFDDNDRSGMPRILALLFRLKE